MELVVSPGNAED